MIVIVNGWLGLKRRDSLAEPHVLGPTDLTDLILIPTTEYAPVERKTFRSWLPRAAVISVNNMLEIP